MSTEKTLIIFKAKKNTILVIPLKIGTNTAHINFFILYNINNNLNNNIHIFSSYA